MTFLYVVLQLVIEEEIIVFLSHLEIIKRGISHLDYLRGAVVAKLISGVIRINNLKLFFLP